MRKAYSAYFLVGFFTFLFLPLAFGVFNSAFGQQNTTVTYYLNVHGNVPSSTCSGSQDVLGSLDSTSPTANSARLNQNGSVWNTFCTPVPIVIGNPLTITSVKLTLFVCCGDKSRYALLPQLVDNSTSSPTILASSGGFIDSSARGASCQSPTKIAVDIPVNRNATLTSGQVLVLQFQFDGHRNPTVCTGSSGIPLLFQNTLSSISITGTATVATRTSTTTSERTSSATTTSSTSTTSISTIQASSTSTDSFILPPPTTTHLLTMSHTTSTGTNINYSLWISVVMAGLVVVASSVIALGGRRS